MALGGVPTRMIEQLLIRGACRCQASLSRPPNTGSRRRSGSAQVSRANAHPFHDAPVCTGQPSTRSISTTSSGVWLKLAYAAWNWPSVSSRKCSRLIVTLNSAESGGSRPSNTTRIGSSPSRYAAMNRGIIDGGDAFANQMGSFRQTRRASSNCRIPQRAAATVTNSCMRVPGICIPFCRRRIRTGSTQLPREGGNY